MQTPKMILFDYGETLMHEPYYNRKLGIEVVMKHAVQNKRGLTAEEVYNELEQVRDEMWNDESAGIVHYRLESCNQSVLRYVLDYCGLDFNISIQEIEDIYWDNAAPGILTNGINAFLDYIWNRNIRTGIISNLIYSGESLTHRIDRGFPNHKFEFMLATSDYLFKKPYGRIFDIAAMKADLNTSDCWYCGDNTDRDVRGSRAAGMQPILYTGTHDSRRPWDKVEIAVNSWDELRTILDKCD